MVKYWVGPTAEQARLHYINRQAQSRVSYQARKEEQGQVGDPKVITSTRIQEEEQRSTLQHGFI